MDSGGSGGQWWAVNSSGGGQWWNGVEASMAGGHYAT